MRVRLALVLAVFIGCLGQQLYSAAVARSEQGMLSEFCATRTWILAEQMVEGEDWARVAMPSICLDLVKPMISMKAR